MKSFCLFASALVLGLLSCNFDIARPPDKAGPTLSIDFPENSDADGDNLIDMRLHWHDSTSVDLQSLKIHLIAQSGVDFAKLWNVSDIDQTGAVLEETISGLLPGGLVQLEVEISDTRGNATRRTALLNLPNATLYKTIYSNRVWNQHDHGTTAVICNDDRLYITAGLYVTVIDPDSLKLIAEIRDPTADDGLLSAVCANSPDLLYASQHAQRFDRHSLSWLPEGASIYAASSIAQSRVDPNKLYIGADGWGTVLVYDRVAERTSGELPGIPHDTSNAEFIYDLAVMPGDRKLYATRRKEGGIAVIDPTKGITKRIPLALQSAVPGQSDDIELSPDNTRLYAAIENGDTRGIGMIDTESDEMIRLFAVPDGRPQTVAISPSGKRAFVTTQDLNNVPSSNYLIDLSVGTILGQFARPRSAPVRWDGGAVFHPNGKLIFVARDLNVDVYLNRE